MLRSDDSNYQAIAEDQNEIDLNEVWQDNFGQNFRSVLKRMNVELSMNILEDIHCGGGGVLSQ